MPHTDIKMDSWVQRVSPLSMRPYVRLLRLDRPIGIWLLMWPCFWGATLASNGAPSPLLLVLFILGSIVMRSAGCIINDIYDRDIDKQVERTRERPLANGEIGLHQAITLLVILFIIGLMILLMFNNFTIWLGGASLFLVFTYPLAKRVTWWPQLVLGFTFNWGALMGWSAVTGSLDVPAFILYVAGIFWTLAYDTIYAIQDQKDDKQVGVKSLALYLGENSRCWIAGFYIHSLLLFGIAGVLAEEGMGFFVMLLVAMTYTIWQLVSLRLHDPANCLKAFRSNNELGMILFIALLVGKFF